MQKIELFDGGVVLLFAWVFCARPLAGPPGVQAGLAIAPDLFG